MYTYRARVKVRHGETDLLVWLEATRGSQHLSGVSDDISRHGKLSAYLDTWWLEGVLGGKEENTVVLAASKGGVGGSPL